MKESWKGPGGMLGNKADALNDPIESPEDDLSRREMLYATGSNAIKLAASIGVVGEIAHTQSERITPNTKSADTSEIHSFTAEAERVEEGPDPQWWKKVWYKVPPKLQGQNIDNNLEWSYIQPDTESGGVLVNPRSLPKIYPPIAFHKNLGKMIDVKKGLTKHVPNSKKQAAFYDSLEESYADLFQKKEVRKMNLSEFSLLIEKESQTVLTELQEKLPEIIEVYLAKHLEGTGWEKGTEGRARYDAAMARCLQSLAERVTPEIMLAYITTELMPAPGRAKAMLEFLSQHAGVEFIERIPAVNDSELSYGPFQFTPSAIGDVATLQKVMGSELVPNSLEKFSSIEDHIRAGHLFAFHNILALVQDICKEGRYMEVITINEVANVGKGSGDSSVFFEFISAAHHRPESALNAMKVWLAENKALPQTKRGKTLATSFKRGKEDQFDREYAEKAQKCLTNIRQV